MEYHMRISGATLVLHENGSSAEEISALLTARFGAAEAAATRAVALEDTSTALVFPLDVVATRPDFVAQSENLRVLFSCSAETVLLSQLKSRGLLSEQEVRTLIPLIEDPYVTAAFEVFREEGDLADLVDTLHRIVAIRINGSSSSAKQTVSANQVLSEEQQQLSGNALVDQLTAALKLPEYPQEPLKQLCNELRAEGKLPAEDEIVLIQLVNKHLPHLQAAYEIYIEEEDEAAFLRSLTRVAKHFGVERVVRGQPYASAILEAFAANNPMVCGAWDVYVDEHNEEDFRDTLARVYRRLSTSSKSSPATSVRKEEIPDIIYTNKPSEEKATLRRFVLWLHAQNRITTEEGQALMSLVDQGSPEAERAMREYMNSARTEADGDKLFEAVKGLIEEGEDPATDEDDDDDENGGLRPLEETYGENPDEDEALRRSIILFLDDCATKGLLSSESVAKLSSLVEIGDHRLLAAFDLFREERDLDDLLDTLQRLAEKVVMVGTEDDEEADDENDQFDEDDVSEMIANMGLSLSQLELIRDAMAMRHPEVEHAIDVFSETGDAGLFKKELLEFCESAAKQGL